jgi:hypothetical protein
VQLEGSTCDKTPLVVSWFGEGIATWRIPLLFRTGPDYNLLVRGPANYPKPGAFALEGLVETDWSAATFTMNWKLLDPGREVVFVEGEPICMIVPQRKGELEGFTPRSLALEDNPALHDHFTQWRVKRLEFNAGPKSRKTWQRDYHQGRGPDGIAERHQTSLSLRPFDVK